MGLPFRRRQELLAPIDLKATSGSIQPAIALDPLPLAEARRWAPKSAVGRALRGWNTNGAARHGRRSAKSPQWSGKYCPCRKPAACNPRWLQSGTIATPAHPDRWDVGKVLMFT
jgi:hypothetical protein